MSTAHGTEQRSDSARWTALGSELEALQADGLWLPGPATTLDVLGRSESETDHERIIAWLLDPRAAHGLGSALLGAVLSEGLRLAGVTVVPPPEQLLHARVRTQVVGASSRPDIVVSMPAYTLVIELKINAGEGLGQTTRQADDHAGLPQPVLVFLTRRGTTPQDTRFKAMKLGFLVDELRRAVAAAPEPSSHAAVSGRAVARDYLATLERMFGMNPADQEAARVWLTHRGSMAQAREAAKQLLVHLPAQAARSLLALAEELGGDLVVSSFPYTARGKDGKAYEEVAVLLSRPAWLSAGKVRLGIGMGQRVEPDPDNAEKSPFWGVYAADPAAFETLHSDWGDCRPWNDWVWWSLLDLEPPAGRADLLPHYAAEVVRQVRATWARDLAQLEQAMSATDGKTAGQATTDQSEPNQAEPGQGAVATISSTARSI